MQASAIAHPNIALVKYWGKRDIPYNLPAAGSLSLTLGGLATRTHVRFDPALDRDRFELDGAPVAEGARLARVRDFLDLIRRRAGLDAFAHVASSNDFPTAAGLASSASGFAALALAACAAAGLDPDARALSILARRGSGSAARSIFGGYVRMHPGHDRRPDIASEEAFAEPLAPADHWDLRCLVAVTAAGPKDVGSTAGMLRTQQTSPFFDEWVASVPADLEAASEAILARDFDALAVVAEQSCLRMHASAIGAAPGVLYWQAGTVDLIHRVRRARADGLPAFFTIDAGPHVKIFCPAHALDDVRDMLDAQQGVLDIIEAHPGGPARLVEAAG